MVFVIGAPMKGQIHLKNMAFYGYHGVFPEEGKLGQRFLVDVSLTYDMLYAAKSDNVEDAVDYSKIFEICKLNLEQGRVKLLETLCDRLLDEVLRECPKVLSVKVMIKKPSVPIQGVLDYAAVEASRDRIPSSR
jgi:7,8-dihydroneopterin aldolase/epimerase/oxygenase